MEPEKIKMQQASLLFKPTTKPEIAGIKPHYYGGGHPCTTRAHPNVRFQWCCPHADNLFVADTP